MGEYAFAGGEGAADRVLVDDSDTGFFPCGYSAVCEHPGELSAGQGEGVRGCRKGHGRQGRFHPLPGCITIKILDKVKYTYIR